MAVAAAPPPIYEQLNARNRSLRGNGLKPAPDVGGVGHSCDLPLGHSCDLPLTSYRSDEIFKRSR